MTDFNYRFSIIPAGAITDPSLEPRDLQVLCLLGRHTNKSGWCHRSQVKMAQEIRCGRSSVQRSLDRLYDAGWVQKRIQGRGDSVPDPDRPHAAHAYRVVLDRDGFQEELAKLPPDDVIADDNAEGCPPVGTLDSGQGGAQPWVGTGCPRMHGHHEGSLEPSPSNLERETRARDKREKLLAELKGKWPTSAIDDQDRISREWAALPDDHLRPAIDRVAAFLDQLKRHKRSTVPALWKYLQQRPWQLLEDVKVPLAAEQAQPDEAVEGSEEWNAWLVFYRAAGQMGIPQYLISSRAGKRFARTASRWPPVGRGLSIDQDEWIDVHEPGQIAAWLRRLREGPHVNIPMRRKRVNDIDVNYLRVPCEWPPAKSAAGPPITISDDDAQALSGQ